MNYKLLALGTFAFCLLLTGCSVTKSVKPPSGSKIKADSAVVFLSVYLENSYRTSYQPEANQLVVKEVSTPQAELVFEVGAPQRNEPYKYNEYLIGLELPAGTYELARIDGASGRLPTVGEFSVPLNLSFSAKSGEALYLGRIEAVNRKRLSGETRAGSLEPIRAVDEAGFFDGTFDVWVLDNAQEDLDRFANFLPDLKSHSSRAVTRLAQKIPARAPQRVAMKLKVRKSTPSITSQPKLREDNSKTTSKSLNLAVKKQSCSTEQVLEMHRLGLDEDRITAACRVQGAFNSTCSVSQVLRMEKLGLNPNQIKAACS